MRAHKLIIGLLAIATLTLTACSNGSSKVAPDDTGQTAVSAPSASSAAKSGGGSLSQTFGQMYTWPDGVKVTVTKAVVFRAYDASLDEKPTPGSTDYQVMVRITNGGSTPLDLTAFSVVTGGATNGGQAETTSWSNGAPGFDGQVAPGVTVVKGDQETLETRFGRRIVVTVQRMAPDNTGIMAFPQFTGTITG